MRNTNIKIHLERSDPFNTPVVFVTALKTAYLRSFSKEDIK